MSDTPKTTWNLLSDSGRLEPTWGTAYMVQQLTIAVVNLGEELRKIRRDMPLNDAAKILREEQAAAKKLQDERHDRWHEAWMYTVGMGAYSLRRLMCVAAEQGEDVFSEAVARVVIESYKSTERQQSSILAWWIGKYPAAEPPVMQLRRKPKSTKSDDAADGGAA